jgi:hypothetical protein
LSGTFLTVFDNLSYDSHVTGHSQGWLFLFMAQPTFFLQIVDRSGKVAHLPGGGQLEADLIDLVTTVVMAKGVGLFKTSKHVEQDIRDGMKEALMGLKAQTVTLA